MKIGYLITTVKHFDEATGTSSKKDNLNNSKALKAEETKDAPRLYSKSEMNISKDYNQHEQSKSVFKVNSESNASMTKQSTLPRTSPSPYRNLDNIASQNLYRSGTADSKSADRFSNSSRKSVVSRLKEKIFGKTKKANIYDEQLIKITMKIVDTTTNKIYNLEDAIINDLTVNEDRILDTLNNLDYSINEAIQKSVIKFFHHINQFEFIFGQSCYIWGNTLFLFNYILDPTRHKKISLNAAFNKVIIDKENALYMGKNGAVSLDIAIKKKAISCEIVDLNLLNSIITSNIAHKRKNNPYTSNIDLKPKSSQIESQPNSKAFDQTSLEKNFDSKLDKKSPIVLQKKNIVSSTDIESDDTENEDSEVVVKGTNAQDHMHQLLNRSISKSEQMEENIYIVPKKVLKESGIEFSEKKSYKISQVFDSGKIFDLLDFYI